MTATIQRAQNVEEIIYNLQAFYHYSLRETLYPVIEKHTVELWTGFMRYIHKLKQELVEEHKHRPVLSPPFGGKALITHMKKKKLIALKQVLLPSCFIQL